MHVYNSSAQSQHSLHPGTAHAQSDLSHSPSQIPNKKSNPSITPNLFSKGINFKNSCAKNIKTECLIFFPFLIVAFHMAVIFCARVYLSVRGKGWIPESRGWYGTSAEFPPLQISSLSLHWKQSVPHHVNRAVLVNIEVTW